MPENRITMSDEGELIFGAAEHEAEFDPCIPLEVAGVVPSYEVLEDGAYANLTFADGDRFTISLSAHTDDLDDRDEATRHEPPADGFRVVSAWPSLADATISFHVASEEDRQALGEALMRLGAMFLGAAPLDEAAIDEAALRRIFGGMDVPSSKRDAS